jgi:hypothetical protein
VQYVQWSDWLYGAGVYVIIFFVAGAVAGWMRNIMG